MPRLEASQRRCAAIAAIVAGASVAGVAFAAPALAVHLEQYIEVPQCQPATSEDCPQIPQVTLTSAKGEGLRAQFTANANHCSDIFVRFFLDGYPQSDWIQVGPGQTTPTDSALFVSPGGTHSFGVKAKGILGGCNTTGVLSAWGGTIRRRGVLQIVDCASRRQHDNLELRSRAVTRSRSLSTRGPGSRRFGCSSCVNGGGSLPVRRSQRHRVCSRGRVLPRQYATRRRRARRMRIRCALATH